MLKESPLLVSHRRHRGDSLKGEIIYMTVFYESSDVYHVSSREKLIEARQAVTFSTDEKKPAKFGDLRVFLKTMILSTTSPLWLRLRQVANNKSIRLKS